MRQTINVDSTAVIEAVTAEIYTSYADLKSQFERIADETVNTAKTELVSETSKLVDKLDEMISKIVEDKVVAFLQSDKVKEAVAEALASLTPEVAMIKKPWWKWW